MSILLEIFEGFKIDVIIKGLIIKQTISSKIIISYFMNIQLSKIITGIISSNKGDPASVIQQLFTLMSVYQSQYHSMIQQAILFSMQSLHEWGNLMKYVQKWRADDFRIGLVRRMRKRLNRSDEIGKEGMEDLKELFQAYWEKRSPKKEENKYIEPIFLKSKIQSVPLILSKDIKGQIISTKKELPNSESQTCKNPLNILNSKQNSNAINQNANTNKQKSIQKPITLNNPENLTKQQTFQIQSLPDSIVVKQIKKEGRISTQNIFKLVKNLQSKQPKSLRKKQELEKEELSLESKKVTNSNLDKANITPVKYNPFDIKNQQQSFSFKREKSVTIDPSISLKKDVKKQSKKPTIKIKKQSEQYNINSHHFESFQKNLKWRNQQNKDHTQDINQVIDLKKNISSISIKQVIDFQHSERKSLKKQSSSLFNLQSKLVHYKDETILEQLMLDIGKDSLRYLRALLE